MKNLSPSERERISAAVAAAGEKSHARFAFVVVRASDRYHLYPVVWGAGLALVSLAALALARPAMPLQLAAEIVLGVFLVSSVVLEWLPLRFAIVPKHSKHAHARVLAHREFAARILTHREPGILFFISLAERYAEIIADHQLHNAAGQAAWDKIVADFTNAAGRGRIADGIIAAANACGAVLEEHHPKA